MWWTGCCAPSAPGARAFASMRCATRSPRLGLREGAFSLRQLQVALGHASLATTQIYTEVADEEIAQAMRLHPLADG